MSVTNWHEIFPAPTGFGDINEELIGFREVNLPDWLDTNPPAVQLMIIQSAVAAWMTTLVQCERQIFRQVYDRLPEERA